MPRYGNLIKHKFLISQVSKFNRQLFGHFPWRVLAVCFGWSKCLIWLKYALVCYKIHSCRAHVLLLRVIIRRVNSSATLLSLQSRLALPKRFLFRQMYVHPLASNRSFNLTSLMWLNTPLPCVWYREFTIDLLFPLTVIGRLDEHWCLNMVA